MRIVAGMTAASLLWIGIAHAEEYHISVVQSLTGPVAFIGAPMADGIVMAIDEINEKQLLGPGNVIKYTMGDDAGDRSQAITLLKRAAVDGRNLLMIGPTSGGIAVAVANAANDEKMPIYTTGAVRDVLKAGPWSNIISNLPDIAITHIAKYTVDTLKAKKCNIITILDNEAYISLAKGFQDYVEKHGVEVVSYEGIRQSETDFAALSHKMVQHPADCLFISAPPNAAANLIIQLKQAGLSPDTRIIGHNAFANQDMIRAGGPAVEGVYLMGDWNPSSSQEAARAFIESHKKKFGREPDNSAPTGYSAMMVVADALRRAGPSPTRQSVRDALVAAKDVDVIIGKGKYSFNEDRIPSYEMNILTIKDGKFLAAPK